MKAVGVYEAIWASQYKLQLDGELMNLVVRWSPTINTIFTCNGELGISLWDVYWITGLPIVAEMYDEFFPPNWLILDKTRLASLRFLFNTWACLTKGLNPTSGSSPKFTSWVKEFIPEALDRNA